MIKGWNKFKNSLDDKFNEDMSMEIIFYFSENSKPTKSIESDFFGIPGVKELRLSFYDSGYDEYVTAGKKLMNLVKNSGEELEQQLIEIYKMIREERKVFPTIAEIEAIFIGLVDSGWSFIVHTNPYEYNIKCEKYDETIENFLRWTKYLDERVKSLDNGPLRATLANAKRFNGFYNTPEPGKEKVLYHEFEVQLRRIDFQKNMMSGKFSPIESTV